MNNKLKFLNLEQLAILVEKIKGLISAAKSDVTISNITFNEEGKLVITQGTNTPKEVTFPTVSNTDTNAVGLLTNAQYKAITDNIIGLQTTTSSAVQMVGTVSSGKTSLYTPLTSVKVGDTTYNNVAAIKLVDDIASATADEKLQAPSTSGVINAISAESTTLQGLINNKLATSDFNTFKNDDYNVFKTLVGSTKDSGLFGEKADSATTLAGYGITDAYTKTETDGLLDDKLDSTTFTTFKTNTYDVFVSETNTALSQKAIASETYTKTEVDTAIANAKKEIIGGDDQHKIAETYDTLIEIADWITGESTGAGALTKQVNKNTTDISTLNTTVFGADGNSGLKSAVEQNTSTITQLSTNKADWGETLADYKIGNAYTKTETETAIDEKVNPIKTDVDTLKLTTVPNKADKTDALGSFTDFAINTTTGNLEAIFTKADGTTNGGTLTIGVITTEDINKLFE